MDKKQNSINQIISELKNEDIKQEDLVFGCIEDMLQNQSIPRYDIFLHETDYAGIYQGSTHYNPY